MLLLMLEKRNPLVIRGLRDFYFLENDLANELISESGKKVIGVVRKRGGRRNSRLTFSENVKASRVAFSELVLCRLLS